MITGWPPGMLQDDCRGLSKWLSNRPGDMRHIGSTMTHPALPARFDVWKETDDEAGPWSRPDYDVFTAEQMHAYLDTDRAQRVVPKIDAAFAAELDAIIMNEELAPRDRLQRVNARLLLNAKPAC